MALACVRIAIAAMASAPALYQVAAEASSGLSAGAGGGRLTGGALRAAGKAGEQLVESRLLARGYTILGRQVSAATSSGRRVIDFLTRDPEGNLVAVEAKAGNAVRTAAQRLKDSRMASEGARLVGKNAPDDMRGQELVMPTIVERP
jgi:Holliday junction resolvase-like predicted endonuclease